MARVFNDKWHIAWLCKGRQLNMITPQAEKELNDLLSKNPQYRPNELIREFEEGKIPAYYETNS